MKYALILNGVVNNIVVWDGVTPYSPNGTLVNLDGSSYVDIGYTYENGVFTAPVVE